MSFREKLLARVDKIGRIPERRLDLRQNTVDILIETWSGDSVGEGTKSVRRKRLHVGGSFNIRVQEVSSKDIVASGGLLTMQHVKVGPFTPEYQGGGLPREIYDPPSQGAEVLFLLKGHGMGRGGSLFKRVNSHDLKNFSSWVFLEAIGVRP
jgi:hypothetical protein